jgi:hypothetical protein
MHVVLLPGSHRLWSMMHVMSAPCDQLRGTRTLQPSVPMGIRDAAPPEVSEMMGGEHAYDGER